ncbi:PH domain-containing protein [Phytoactinopolyspora halotolerans]|uniref:PH domain-containing protein n=1 Tax=Phytoactinopolyspora halotolerans TaxID=1981512 RepID=A0A6L9SFH9_9ACTN|nr:PH domain-containing protein [Phytoactinopolyspora halotolerans]NEE02810.1 PH domain-containing protein [Phytoactinopolyspora halotolerans]
MASAEQRRPPSGTGALRLRPPGNRIERKAVWWWIAQAVVMPGSLLAAVSVGYLLWEAARPWLIVAVVVLAVLTSVSLFVEPFWRYAVHRWEVTDEAVYALTGWLVREWRVAPISRIQTVDAVRGPVEQMLGLATLRVTTASSRGPINIGGLDRDVAAAIAERLTAVTQRTPGDAT